MPIGSLHQKFADVTVQLLGQDGNAFFIIARVTKALKKAGHQDGASAFAEAATKCESYDDLLRLTMETVNVD